MRRGNINRAAALAAAVAAAAVTLDASGATHTYTPANGTGNWSAGVTAGWDTTPISAANTTLVFGAGAIPDGSTSATNNDVGNPFLMNVMTLGGAGTATPSTIDITGNPLQLLNNGGTTPVVNLTATAGLTYNVANAVTLANDTAFTGTGSGAFNFNGGINAPGVTLTKSGVGNGNTLTLGGTSTLGALNMIGGTAANNSRLVLASGATLNLGSTSARTVLNVDAGVNAVGGSTADFSAGTINATLSGLNIGFPSGGSNAGNGTVIIGTNAANHLDVVAAGGAAVVIGRLANRTGTLTINNLDATSQIVNSTVNQPAILLGSSNGSAVLNLNGGTLTLAGNGTGAGIIHTTPGTNSTANFNGTQLKVGSSVTNGVNWITGVNNANVQAGGLKIDTNGMSVTSNQLFKHDAALGATPDGGFTKSGFGTFTLSSTANTYTGPTNVNAGRLDLTGSITSTSAMTVNAGAALGGEGSIAGSLTFNGASTFFFNPTTGGAFTAGSVDGTAGAVEVLGSSSPIGTGFVVLNAAGGITGTPGTNFIYNGRGTISLNVGSTQLLVDNTAGAASLIWKGDQASPTFWDVKTTSNWDNAGSPDQFFSADNVSFDDSATTFTVAVQGATVYPGSVSFTNATNAYTLSGGGAIAGPGSLTKSGAASVTISSNNTYTGGTTISSGIIQLGDGVNATGSLGSGDVTNNASLITDFGANTATLANKMTGTGTLTKNGSGTLIIPIAANTYSGGTTISSGTLQLGDGVNFTASLGAGPVTNNGTLLFNLGNAATFANDVSGTGGLTQGGGGGAVTLTGANSYLGTTTVNAGSILQVGSNGFVGTLGAGPVSVAGTLNINRADAYTIPGTLSGTGTLNKLAAGTLTLGAATNSIGNLNIGNQASTGTVTVAGASTLSIGSGAANNILVGGSLAINNNNAYSGTLDLTPASTFTADVGLFAVGYTAGGSPLASSSGTLLLGAASDITARTEFRIGRSDNQPMNPGGVASTAASSTTTVKTPAFTVATGKSSGSFTLGAGATLEVSGVLPAERAALTVGTATLATGNPATAALDLSGGTFDGALGAVVVGDHSHSGAGNLTASVVLSNSPTNHVDVSAAGTAVLVGRKQVAGAATADATLTLGNLDATSSVTSTDNGTGILLGTNANANGTLNLNGGTLTITTTGAAIAGGGNGGTSTVNFNGATLIAGASSAGWIQNLTTANFAAGGAVFDSNGFDLVTAQVFSGSGGLTKNGAGTLTVSALNTYTGDTTVNGGTLVVTQGIKNNAALTIAAGARAAVPNVTPSTYNPPATVPSGNDANGSKISALNIANDGAPLGDRTYTGQLDLGNSDLVVDYTGTSPLDDVKDMLRSGYNFGGWDGQGINSDALNANNAEPLDASTFGFGYAENDGSLPTLYGDGTTDPLFFGQAVDQTTVMVKFTWIGDLNLDGFVDFQDLSVFNTNYDNGASSGRYWFEGDFNYDGFIDFQDLSLFNTNYDPSKPSLPEPGTAGLLGLSALFGRRRRRR